MRYIETKQQGLASLKSKVDDLADAVNGQLGNGNAQCSDEWASKNGKTSSMPAANAPHYTMQPEDKDFTMEQQDWNEFDDTGLKLLSRQPFSLTLEVKRNDHQVLHVVNGLLYINGRYNRPWNMNYMTRKLDLTEHISQFKVGDTRYVTMGVYYDIENDSFTIVGPLLEKIANDNAFNSKPDLSTLLCFDDVTSPTPYTGDGYLFGRAVLGKVTASQCTVPNWTSVVIYDVIDYKNFMPTVIITKECDSSYE